MFCGCSSRARLCARPRSAKKPAERRHPDRLLDRGGVKLGDRAARPAACVIDDKIEPLAAGIDLSEQPLDLVGAAGVAGNRGCTGLGGQRGQFTGVACRQHNIHLVPRGAAGQCRAEPRPRPDDQRPLAFRHGLLLTIDGTAITAPARVVIAQKSWPTPEPSGREAGAAASPQRSDGTACATPRWYQDLSRTAANWHSSIRSYDRSCDNLIVQVSWVCRIRLIQEYIIVNIF